MTAEAGRPEPFWTPAALIAVVVAAAGLGARTAAAGEDGLDRAGVQWALCLEWAFAG